VLSKLGVGLVSVVHFGILFMHESSYCFRRVLAIAILSVCLSVRLLHEWISQKRCKLELPNFHH